MKIGTSLGKCIRSLLDKEVDYDDVLFIVANTHAPTPEKLDGVVEEYYYDHSGRPPEYDFSHHSIDDARILARNLMSDGKLHQPRCAGADTWSRNHHLQDTWYDIMPSATSQNESVLEAWNAYRMLSELTR
jgi:hypothetical protein